MIAGLICDESQPFPLPDQFVAVFDSIGYFFSNTGKDGLKYLLIRRMLFYRPAVFISGHDKALVVFPGPVDEILAVGTEHRRDHLVKCRTFLAVHYDKPISAFPCGIGIIAAIFAVGQAGRFIVLFPLL